jgi:hypothetical protein
LGDMQPLSRTGHILLFGDHDKVTKVAKFHIPNYTRKVFSAKQDDLSPFHHAGRRVQP